MLEAFSISLVSLSHWATSHFASTFPSAATEASTNSLADLEAEDPLLAVEDGDDLAVRVGHVPAAAQRSVGDAVEDENAGLGAPIVHRLLQGRVSLRPGELSRLRFDDERRLPAAGLGGVEGHQEVAGLRAGDQPGLVLDAADLITEPSVDRDQLDLDLVLERHPLLSRALSLRVEQLLLLELLDQRCDLRHSVGVRPDDQLELLGDLVVRGGERSLLPEQLGECIRLSLAKRRGEPKLPSLSGFPTDG